MLVNEYEVYPFSQQQEEDADSSSGEAAAAAAASPFLAASRPPNTAIFDHLLGVWDERFASSNGGKNSEGDYPIHVVCCDPLVSLDVLWF